MKPDCFLVLLVSLTLATAAAAKSSDACQYSGTDKVHQLLKSRYDSQFTYEQNFYFVLDSFILQEDALALARCVLKHSKSAKKLRNSFERVYFSPMVYLYPASDYSYGMVGYSRGMLGFTEDSNALKPSGVVAKITYKIGLDGRAREFDSIVTEFSDGPEPRWFRFEGNSFKRKDHQCLECHEKQRSSAYLFLEKNFKRLPIP